MLHKIQPEPQCRSSRPFGKRVEKITKERINALGYSACVSLPVVPASRAGQHTTDAIDQDPDEHQPLTTVPQPHRSAPCSRKSDHAEVVVRNSRGDSSLKIAHKLLDHPAIHKPRSFAGIFARGSLTKFAISSRSAAKGPSHPPSIKHPRVRPALVIEPRKEEASTGTRRSSEGK